MVHVNMLIQLHKYTCFHTKVGMVIKLKYEWLNLQV